MENIMSLASIQSVEQRVFVRAISENFMTSFPHRQERPMEITESEKEPKSPTKTVERVTLGKEEVEKVAAWLKQLEASSSGFLTLSRSDVVNFLIRDRKPELSPKEIQQIRVQHYDPISHLNWITPRLKEAIKKGDTDAVGSIQNEIRRIELSVISKGKNGDGSSPHNVLTSSGQRQKRRPRSDSKEPSERPPMGKTQGDLAEG
jgi:hypothetical protein